MTPARPARGHLFLRGDPAPVVTGNVYKKITLDDYDKANKYITDEAPGILGIPRKLHVTYGQTDSLPC